MVDVFTRRARNHRLVRELRARNDRIARNLGLTAKELQVARARLEAAAVRAHGGAR